ncbi:TerC family protein [Phyllobacterium sp. BT25]|uniref:TerC family protein n=1 Tax=Phyllobacterium pellucidum TaxID=2740464 RepID=A0A849VVW2_9HYPH|nr:MULTISPECIES: TerC family protein [Phyllobacterium]NTS32120.1 TerC family protein [Phyllobacterium pellucidum]UGY09538.1 TerC family protein [Phyllobacterium sp. T1018]
MEWTLDWIADPNAWIGLLTLIVLEIVLGIDNLVFIAILADKLPAHQRNRARILGLSLALIMRLLLLASISWVVKLTTPLFSVAGFGFSGRDIILIIGGVFLLFKGTMELHERLEGHLSAKETNAANAVFWQVIAQIVVLDAVFSLDSVITAVGMVKYLEVMMIAVVIAVGVMMLAAKPLMNFVNRHPTVVILCLGFLMMIGFSLIVEGFGFHIPKGYLYAAIGFSVLVEAANQLGRHNREKHVTTMDLRDRTAGAVLRLLGGGRGAEAPHSDTLDVIAEHSAASDVFHPEEKEMIRGVLDLVERPVRSIMSPRNEVEWLDLDETNEELLAEIRTLSHSRVVLARGRVDEFVGVALTKDLLFAILDGGKIDWEKVTRQPLIFHENANVLRVMEQLRGSYVQMGVVLDEHGSFEGIVTPTDVLEAIAGDFPEEGEDSPVIERAEDGSMVVDGYIDIRRLGGLIDRDLVDDGDRYTTLAGYILWNMGHIPAAGEKLTVDDLEFEIVEMEGRNIGKVRISPAQTAAFI